MNILAVIPARGDSKRIINKNIRILRGNPLIFYSIQTAIRSQYINDTVVTSDNEEILSYVSRFHVYKRKRPLELAADDITLDPVVKDALDYMNEKTGKKYDIVITLQPTSPLLKTTTLDEALKVFLSKNFDTIISVYDATHLMWRIKNGDCLPDYEKRLNRQWLPKKFKETGAFIITRANFVTNNSRFGPQLSTFVIKQDESIDIDSPIDFLLCEKILSIVRIGFVVIGDFLSGFGHVYRCLTLANSLIGYDIIFFALDCNQNAIDLIQNNGYKVVKTENSNLLENITKNKPDIIVNDILDTEVDFIKKLRDLELFVVNFEDLGAGAEKTHLTFNALYEKTHVSSNHRFGSSYVCLAEQFLFSEPIEFSIEPKTLLVTFGGVDLNNLTCLVLRSLKRILNETSLKRVIIILGMGFKHHKRLQEEMNNISNIVKEKIVILNSVDKMATIMKTSDLAITSNGRTIYELSSLGIPTISISQNDRETLHLFSRYYKGVEYLGIACNVDSELLASTVIDICTNDKLRKSMHKCQLKESENIKKGIQRVKEEILSSYWKWKDSIKS
ncbi:MAG: cytidylyltransferase domain-containing protein [Candidatus Hodarchaeota archaeon]